jgi:hypothetical protein
MTDCLFARADTQLAIGIAGLDGLIGLGSIFLVKTAVNAWVLRIRRQARVRCCTQDKKLFDRGENASARLVQNLVKDGGDDVGGSGGCSGVCGWGETHSKSDSVVTRLGGL